jgi:hypothetical protein
MTPTPGIGMDHRRHPGRGGRNGDAVPATPARRPLSRRLQARAMSAANVPMRRILGLPVRTPMSKRLMLATIVGRRTGRVYRQPISYVRDGDGTLLTPGGGRWKLNLDPDRPVTLRIGGQDRPARPEIISDVEEIERLLGVIAAGNPSARKFVGVPSDEHGRLDRDALARAVHFGFRIVRWHPDEPFRD